MTNRYSVRTLMSDLDALLHTPIPGLGFLSMPIPMPSFRKSTRRRAKGVQTAPDTPRSFDTYGELQRGTDTKFAIGGHDFIINHNTWIIGNLELGYKAKVRGLMIAGGKRVATKVLVETDYNKKEAVV